MLADISAEMHNFESINVLLLLLLLLLLLFVSALSTVFRRTIIRLKKETCF